MQVKKNVRRTIAAVVAGYKNGTIPVSPAQRENELKSLAADAEKPKQVREVYDDEE